MHIIKPIWLTHGGEKKDFEVYSCHVSPDGQRLVTAAGDGYVRIWSTEAIYNATNGKYDKPKQLASMSYHSGTIHAVRFSPGGKYLASGADDKIVCIYTLDPSPPSHAAFGSNEAPPVENWRIFRRLIGHDNDVQDLGWSYDGTILVSVGLDSKVVVWSGYTFEKLKTLSNHSSHVKGITFDPANKYFATASDDRTIRIFRFTSPTQNYTSHDAVNNFILETTISQPFINSPLTTYFRRCSWAPDGQHIAAANAVNGPVSAIVIINRGTWDGDTSLIGHEGPVEVCAFSPRLYGPEQVTRPTPEGHLAPHNTVIACGGADKCLSIWTTNNPRPLVVQQDVAGKPISDIAWSPDGQTLFATALDGTILTVMFEPGELGYPRPIEENDRSLSKFGTSRKGLGFPETTEALRLEELSKAGELKGVEGRMGALMGDHHSSQSGAASTTATTNGATTTSTTTNTTTTENLQNGTEARPTAQATAKAQDDLNQAKLERLKNRVEITKDGKKRIRPLLVSGAGGAESSLPQTKLVSASANNVQTVDTPQSVLDLSKPFDGLPKGGIATLLLGNKRKYAQIEGEEEGTTEKRIQAASQKGAVPILTNAPDGLLPAQHQPPTSGQDVTPEWIRPAVINPAISVSQLRLAVPKVRAHIVQGIDSAGKPAEVSNDAAGASASNNKIRAEFVLEARNPSGPSLTPRAQDREPCRITLTRKDQPLWQDFIPRPVLLVTGNHKFWAAADEAGSLYMWTPHGRRLNSAIVLESQPVILAAYESWLLCITSVGMCYVWNVKTMSSPHPPVSLAPVLDTATHSLAAHPTGAPAITHARLNSEGRIIVTLSNGEGYAYSPQMYCWQRLSEVWWAVGSQYWNTTDSSVGNVQSSKGSAAGGALEQQQQQPSTTAINVSSGIIPWLERNTTSETLLRGRAYFLQRLVKVLLSREGFESFESGVSIAHLENRIAAALMLGAKDEFRIYLLMYAKRLGAEGLRLKVEELLRTLVGGIVEEEDDDTENGGENSAAVAVMKNSNPNAVPGRNWHEESKTICGWPREELLKDVVLLLGKHRDLQRITVPYARMLRIVDADGGASGTNGSNPDEMAL
ncbi:HIR complex subunit [Exophiala dermatitidis]|uniref:Protein HIR n=2 Tax=Exophiala dermatitidis TaxID=5970 RepID=H6BU86_EXODN|nr:protein HIR1 [Exophiala dermatitidis NIH/UT8656]KAJ4506601.1 HIR complex subunit [Exophiala dermatitidis]EHY55663.1 protein HIR1 [Exophiala dermatitidis NIH/UT8656]KAJ4508875.1 HIR complex subunit [Exophiala dermatitidis]KAJ4510127.1 HIR complex subunit [Exophiala dermatitidis]KAJ4539130.1 HIR complex subunit [Exophiala dermatitidis]